MRTSAYTLRGYRPERISHEYKKTQLADPSVHELIPWCQIDAEPQAVHSRADVDLHAVAQYQLCQACTGQQWLVPPPG